MSQLTEEQIEFVNKHINELIAFGAGGSPRPLVALIFKMALLQSGECVVISTV